jgi:colanic acid/amylovoran biosynthesis glycosyltransferase
MSENKIDIVSCAHYASTYLPLTENWIYRILVNHKKFKPIFLSRKKENLSLFPIDHRYSLSDFGVLKKYIEILLFKILGYFFFFEKACRTNRVKVLHVHFGYHGIKMLGLKRKLNIPMICSFYGDDAFSFPSSEHRREKYRNLFKQADRILALGPYMKSHLIELGCSEDKIVIHHLGIDVDKIEFRQRKISKGDKLKFLIASSFVEKKGIDLAVKALSEFKDRFEFSLDIIGDGHLKGEILQLIESSGIQDRVKLHGYKPYDYFIDLAYQCDVFIQASRTTDDNRKEGTPMAIVDAMATGMAIISTRHSDIPEIVKDGEHGYLAEENSVVSLGDCFEKIFAAPNAIEAFSLNGRRWVEKEFNAKSQTEKLEKFYSELIEAAG